MGVTGRILAKVSITYPDTMESNDPMAIVLSHTYTFGLLSFVP